jgi:2-oxoglutarate ferredoxin oxidoreductase subunit alpha
MIERDVTIRIGGEAGMGLESSGAGFAKALTRGGLYTFGVPDFYSRIRGGHNFFYTQGGSAAAPRDHGSGALVGCAGHGDRPPPW